MDSDDHIKYCPLIQVHLKHANSQILDFIHISKHPKSFKMAALPQYLAEEELHRASLSSIRSANLSHGRGGAGKLFSIYFHSLHY